MTETGSGFVATRSSSRTGDYFLVSHRTWGNSSSGATSRLKDRHLFLGTLLLLKTLKNRSPQRRSRQHRGLWVKFCGSHFAADRTWPMP